MEIQSFMPRVYVKGEIKSLPEINDGYSCYYSTSKTASQALLAIALRYPQVEGGDIIKLIGGGHYKTIYKMAHPLNYK